MSNEVIGSALYLVATPIGNLSDLSPRAQKVLSEVDFIAAEDTRVTMKLLTHFGIRKPLVSYYEHNAKSRGEELIDRLLNGESCALVSDAGTPAVSDPGEDIVRLCCEKGVRVFSVPGCCAAISALTLSGLPTGKFVFEGFLPVPKPERRQRLASLAYETRTTILYEAPHRLKTTLADLFSTLGERRISLSREITKLNEETIRTTLSAAQKLYEEKAPRGEYVLVLEGAEENSSLFWENMSIKDHYFHYRNEGLDHKSAVKKTASDRNIAKNVVYMECLDADTEK